MMRTSSVMSRYAICIFAVTLYGVCMSQTYDYDLYPLDYGETPISPSDSLPSPFSSPGPEENSLEQSLEPYKSSLVALFGSLDVLQQKVLEPVSVIMPDFFIFDQVHFILKSKLAEVEHQLTSQEREEVNQVIHVIEEERSRSLEVPDFDRYFNQVNHTRASMDCAIGRVKADSYYSDIWTTSRWVCQDTIPSMWHDLVNVDYSNRDCDLNQTLSALLTIEQAGKRQEGSTNGIKHKLLFTISKPSHLRFLTPLLCEDVEAKQCELYLLVLCEETQYEMVYEITNKIQMGVATHTPSTTADMQVLLDVQTGLGQVTNALTNPHAARNPVVVQAAHGMLDSYMGIVDTAIGGDSVNTWKKTSRSNTQKQFQQVLVNNEEYVGFVSDMIFERAGGGQSTEVDKETLSVKMQRISSNNDQRGKVEFSFDDAQIWTEALTSPELDRSDVNVYALYYKSWHEMLRDIGGREPRLADLNTSLGATPRGATKQRYFIGKGGIVSLSTRTNQVKKSVPVTYRMRFDQNQTFTYENGSVARRCLSCGYLDVVSGVWQSNGCTVSTVDGTGVTCHCNHTTNFAAFMMPFDADYETTEAQDLALNILEYVGSATSSIGLLISFIAFCIVRNTVRNDRLRAHMNLSIALLFVHLIQLGADFAVNDNNLCIVTTVATHYFLLAAFMWMLVEGIFLYLYVVQVFVHSRLENRRWMYLIGWLVPAVIVAISAGYGLPNEVYVQARPAVDKPTCEEGEMLYPPFHDPYENLKYAACWLNTYSGMTWSFIGPAILVIIFNLVILCKVVQVLVKLSDRSSGMKPFQPSDRGYPNYGYQNKSKPSIQISPVKPLTAEMRLQEHSNNAEESSFSNDTLHGNVITHSGSYSKSRTNSQVYSHHHVLERPRAASASVANEDNFLKDVKTAVKGAMVLLPLLGIPWIFGMLGYKSYVIKIIFVILNSAQGVAIFLVYCVFNGEVCRALQRHLQIYRMNRYHTDRGRTGSTSSLKSAINRGLLRNWRRRSTAVSTLSGSNNA